MLESDSYDRKLSWYERWALRGHLLVCSVCRKLHRQLRFLDSTHQHMADEHQELAGCRLSEDAMERMQKAIQEESSNS